ncbi:ECF transporter S component [Paraclostridium bifermentans]|uniref:ECF transporter S component n=1 Tax=Paraclostridium bifermentans TaxID=1490 RepID=UPI00359C9D2A
MKTQVGVAKKINVRQMAVIGMLSAISIMLSMTPLGFIPIGPIDATIMHIPVIIGAIIEGPIVGGIIGFIFGFTSFIRALTMPNITSFAFMNPLISIIPRVIMGVASYYVYKGVFKVSKNISAAGAFSGMIGSLLNTFGVLGMIYLLYAQRYVEAIGGDTSTAGAVILGIAATNGIPEAIIGALVVSGVVTILKKSKK